MRFLIISDEFMWTAGAWRLVQEGHDVRVWCKKAEGKEHLQNMVKQVPTLEQGLAWLGKDGYFIRDDEKDVSFLRRRGYKGYGGNKWTEKMENDRVYELETCKAAGLNISNFHKIKTIKEGIDFIRKHPDAYALKQMADLPKTFSYVGKDDDGEDVIDQLLWMEKQPEFKKMGGNTPFLLQEVCEGVEVAVAAWWMYDDFKRDDNGDVVIEINFENKKALDGDLGLTCGESGTVLRFTTEHKKLFEETLEKLTPVFKKNLSDCCIDVDLNLGVVEEDGKIVPYLYETTFREGYPCCALQQFLLKTDLGDFFADLIDGVQGNIEWKDEWGVVTVVGAGQYPDESDNHFGSFKDQPVKFPFTLEKWDDHVSPFYIRYDKEKKYFRVADFYEYVAGISYSNNDIAKANEACVAMMDRIDVRAKQYRHDIGKTVVEERLPFLKKHGYF